MLNHAIPLWGVVYDGNSDRSYVFTSCDKLIASVSGSLNEYYGDGCSAFVSDLSNELKAMQYKSFGFSVDISSLDAPDNLVSGMFIFRIDIDHTNIICKLLLEYYNSTDNLNTKQSIEKLFCKI